MKTVVDAHCSLGSLERVAAHRNMEITANPIAGELCEVWQGQLDTRFGTIAERGGENVAEPAKSENDAPLEASVPEGAVPVESILCTQELRRRPWRTPDYKKENRALVALATARPNRRTPFFIHGPRRSWTSPGPTHLA